jgi:hypothetical protein
MRRAVDSHHVSYDDLFFGRKGAHTVGNSVVFLVQLVVDAYSVPGLRMMLVLEGKANEFTQQQQ